MTPESSVTPAETNKARLESERLHRTLSDLEVSIDDIRTEEEVEEIALSVLDRDEEAVTLLTKIKSIQSRGGDDAEPVAKRKRMLENIKIEIGLICGVEIEANDHANQREVYRERADRVLSVLPAGTSDEDLMSALGMIKPVEGKRGHVFTFPYDFFPPYIKQQWERYVAIVEQELAARNKLQKGIITQTDFDTVDFMRGKAHNTVAQSIGDFLEFPEWGLDEYRRLISKMLEEKFAQPTGELQDTARALRGYVNEHLRVTRDAIVGHKSRPEFDKAS